LRVPAMLGGFGLQILPTNVWETAQNRLFAS
jgi:hypothetical protein